MGRPVEIMDEDVIRAGGALVAEDRAVNATRLWARVGKRGRPDRLMAVWNRHVEASTTETHEPSGPIAALPEAAARLLSECKTQIGTGLDGCVREIYAAVERTLVGRFQAEMAATTSSRQAHQAELEEAWRALEELAEEHDAVLLQMHACERDVLTTHATLEAERGILSRMEEDKGALSARIDVLAADVAASVDLARSAEVERVRAEALADAVRAELHATQAALVGLRAANLGLERDTCASQLTCQLHEAQIHRQAGELLAARAELADARERQSEQAIRAAGAERALQALERVVAGPDAQSRTAGFNSKRSRRRPTTASQADAPIAAMASATADDGYTSGLAA